MDFHLAKRAQVAPFLAMEILREANMMEAQGETIFHMEIGQPAHSLPDAVLERIQHALQNEYLGYTNASGLPCLKQKITEHYQNEYGEDVAPEQIVITTGSSAGFLLAFIATLNAGDKVGMPVPGYPAYRNIFHALDVETYDVYSHFHDSDEATESRLLDECQKGIAEGIKRLLIASPSNPTGSIISPEGISALVKNCEDNNIWFYSDEIYHGLAYDKQTKTAVNLSEKAIVINSFSKYFGMTGWRIGWLVVPEKLVKPIEYLAQSLYISPPTISQIAAREALNTSSLFAETKEYYKRNRDILTSALDKAGIDYFPADGAFYVYANIAPSKLSSLVFSQKLLENQCVAVTPGVDFDTQYGQDYIRLSYAGKPEMVAEATARIIHFYQNC